MSKVFKFRIYQNKEQKIMTGRTFGCVSFVYKRMLAVMIGYYGKTHYSLKSRLTHCKQEFPGSNIYSNCGVILDMDLNASYNIIEKGKHRTHGHKGIACILQPIVCRNKETRFCKWLGYVKYI